MYRIIQKERVCMCVYVCVCVCVSQKRTDTLGEYFLDNK
jgi:hypothetical protein